MVRYILRRLAQSAIVVLLVSLFAFSLLYLMPGDPVYAMMGGDITQEQYDIAYQQLGLDRPVIERYFDWIGSFLQGDFGRSYQNRMPVRDMIAARLPITLYLGFLSILISTAVGVIFGVIASTRRGKLSDAIITVFANLGAAVPLFWLAVMGMYVFSLKLGLLPAYGFSFPTQGLEMSIKQCILPVSVLSVGAISGMTRQTRSSMLEVIAQDYIRAARAKGLPEGRVVRSHALPNALIPVITLVGISFRNLVAGSVSVEKIFSIPGMGSMLINAVLSKDVAVTQACILIIAVVICLSNLLVDISYAWLDPRIRLQ
ncbi:MAG: ABC transporter permease [Christensenellaceae bacterium]|nr:ABC transporter permease [Christensenellaceae bacterium]